MLQLACKETIESGKKLVNVFLITTVNLEDCLAYDHQLRHIIHGSLRCLDPKIGGRH